MDDIGLGNLTPFGRGRRELKVLPRGHGEDLQTVKRQHCACYILLIKNNFLGMFVHHLNPILFLGYNARGFASGGS